ncbi:MAG: response regulator, partial [Pseudomonadota bacterium]
SMVDKTEYPEMQVLVVDDDPAIGHLMRVFLSREGYAPVVCVHPRDALALFEPRRFGLAFIDIQMPEMNGLELATRIKEEDAACEVVFMTGHGTFDNAVQAIKIGAYDYMRKPFGGEEIQLCLKRFQERQALREQVRRAEKRYFHLVQNIPSLVFVLCEDFSLEFVNQSCQRILGFAPEEVLGRSGWLLERAHPDVTSNGSAVSWGPCSRARVQGFPPSAACATGGGRWFTPLWSRFRSPQVRSTIRSTELKG